MNFSALLTTVATLFLMLIVGFFAGKLGIVHPTASKNLSRLIITIGQPALIIYSLVKMEYSAEHLKFGFGVLLLGLALHLFFSLIAYVAFLPIRSLDERKLTEFAAIFGNVGFIGFPILESLLGDMGVFAGAFFVVSFNLTLWTWGIAILARKREDIKLTPKKILLNYGTVPSLIGVVIYLLKGLLPSVLPQGVMTGISYAAPAFLTALSYLSSLCTPISMLIIGALLARSNPLRLFTSGKLYYLCAVKLFALPLLVCGIMKLLGFDAFLIQFAVVVSAMPSATTATMLAELHEISPTYSAATIGFTSLISTLSMPLVIGLSQMIIML